MEPSTVIPTHDLARLIATTIARMIFRGEVPDLLADRQAAPRGAVLVEASGVVPIPGSELAGGGVRLLYLPRARLDDPALWPDGLPRAAHDAMRLIDRMDPDAELVLVVALATYTGTFRIRDDRLARAA